MRQEWEGPGVAARVGGRWAGALSSEPAGGRANAGPGDRLAVCVASGGRAGARAGGEEPAMAVEAMHWGLLTPAEARGAAPADHFRRFNARVETAADKPVFGRLLRTGSRCALPVQGYYEWRAEGPRGSAVKQPYYLYLAREEGAKGAGGGGEGGDVMYMAGLYDRGEVAGAGGTFTVLTTAAEPRVAWLHERMPVILPDTAAARRWLRPGALSLEEFVSASCCGPRLHWRPVSPQINDGRYQGADCALLVEPEVRRASGDLRALLQRAGGGAVSGAPGRAHGGQTQDAGKKSVKRRASEAAGMGARRPSSGGKKARSQQPRLSFDPPPPDGRRPRLDPGEHEAADLAEALARSREDF